MTGAPPLHPGLNLGPDHPAAAAAAERVMFGFWVFMMSDLILFGAFLGTYASMANPIGRAMGPGPEQLFNLGSVALQTTLLLGSSYSMALAGLAMAGRRAGLVGWLLLSLLLAVGFLVLEMRDLAEMIRLGAGPGRSGWLSSFFALVGLHGLHVAAACLWLVVMLVQIRVFGPSDAVRLRLLRLVLFWHFLDIVWIGVVSVVFLGGLA